MQKAECKHGHKRGEGYRGRCVTCHRLRNANWRKRTYNVTPERYTTMLAEQNNRCSICKIEFGKLRPCIDHNHACCDRAGSCGKCVRGLLCRTCNQLLRALEPSQWKSAAEAYL